MDIAAPRMAFTGDFTMLQQNNPGMWSQASGGITSGKKLQEIDPDHKIPTNEDTNYLALEEKNRLQSVLNQTMQNQSYGTTMLNNMGARFNAGTDMSKVNQGGADSYIQVGTGGKDAPTTPVVLPADLTTYDRMAAAPEHDVGSMTNPNTLGESLGGLINKVHDKTVEYESQSNALINKDKGSAFEVAKDSMFSDYQSLSGVNKTEEGKSDIERQIESFVEVMNGSYEYYIYSSLLVDSGKSISQTAQTLTKG